MPLLAAEFERELLNSHRPHNMSLLGIAPEGPLCTWASAEEELTACIARCVRQNEINEQPAAREALNKERSRLEKVPVWDLHNPVSWKEVSAKARSNGTKAIRIVAYGDTAPLQRLA